MGKDKFKKRKERKRLIRAELLRRNILVRDIAAGLGVTIQAVYKGMGAGSARVKAALIEAGVPTRMFKADSSTQPKSPLTPPLQRGGGRGG
jgi:hypothetical protein